MKTTRYVQVLVVLLAVALCWSMLAPTAISADKTNALTGGCKCNWNAADFCPLSADAPPGGACTAMYAWAGGVGSHTPFPAVFCTGIAFCDEVESMVCPV